MLFRVYANNTQYKCHVNNGIFRSTEYKLRSLDGLVYLKSRIKTLEELVTDLEYSFTPVEDKYSEFGNILKDLRENLNKIISDSESNIFYFSDFSLLKNQAKDLDRYTKNTDVENALKTNEFLSYFNAFSTASLASLGFSCMIHVFSPGEQSFYTSLKKGVTLGSLVGLFYLFFQIDDYLTTNNRVDIILQHCTANEELVGLVYQFCSEVT